MKTTPSSVHRQQSSGLQPSSRCYRPLLLGRRNRAPIIWRRYAHHNWRSRSFPCFCRFADFTRLFRGRRTRFVQVAVTAAAVTLLLYWALSGREATNDYDYDLIEGDFPSQNNASEKCAIPRLDPWDPSIRQYLEAATPLKCKRLQPELTYLDAETSTLFINQTEVEAERLTGDALRQCRWRCVGKLDGDDFRLDYGKWSRLRNGTRVAGCEFVDVQCFASRFSPTPFYTNVHAQIVVQPDVVEGSLNASTTTTRTRQPPSVLLFVVDSVSQSNWRRSLPKTLRTLIEHYRATVFDGFVKVGDNSFPNAMAFMTGKRVFAPGYASELPDDMTSSHFDDWPLIWDNFAAQGYATFYAEDNVHFNLFAYLSNGFRRQPTRHYFRPFWLRADETLLFRRSTPMCFGNRPNHRVQLDYLEQMVHNYHRVRRPFFALNWLSELGHDWMNQVSVGDADFAAFLKRQRAALADAFMFVFADHGHRFDPIRRSAVGRIEERMPFFSIHLPRWLDDERPTVRETISKNAKRLTTFWDVYVTLRDILHLSVADAWKELSASPLSSAADDGDDAHKRQPVERFRRDYASRGLSLLRPLPLRNCATAAVPREFCVCEREQSLDVQDLRVRSAVAALLRHVNGLLHDNAEGKCANLAEDRTLEAQLLFHDAETSDVGGALASWFCGSGGPSTSLLLHRLFGDCRTPHSPHFRITVRLRPSGAILEAAVRRMVVAAGTPPTFTVIGDVNRLNKYGNQSVCVRSALLRKFCFCK